MKTTDIADGDIVACIRPVEAMYSRNQIAFAPFLLPEVWFTPNLTGVAKSVKCPWVRRAERDENGKLIHGHYFVSVAFVSPVDGQEWRAAVDYNNIRKVKP